tara:strand:+ start:54 stop:164 length:111 start_codon:yes stop_codon:yes gene_type:complete
MEEIVNRAKQKFLWMPHINLNAPELQNDINFKNIKS